MQVKKLLLVLVAINIFLFGVSSSMQHANAEVISKVATQVAKKVAKEFVQDAAVNTAVKMTINFTMPKEKLDNYKALESGYDAVCLPTDSGKKDVECKKPVQVKKSLTENDKKLIANKAEEILERKAGVTGWKKWLDWIVPIFLVGTAVNWLTAKLDPDTEGLFDSVAKEALVETGIIKEMIPTKDIEYTDSEGNGLKAPDVNVIETSNGTYVSPDINKFGEVKFVKTGSTMSRFTMNTGTIYVSNIYMHIQRKIFTNEAYLTKEIDIGPVYGGRVLRLTRSGSNGSGYLVYDSVPGTGTSSQSPETMVNSVVKINGVEVARVAHKNSEYATGNIEQLGFDFDMNSISDIYISPIRVLSPSNASKYRVSGGVISSNNYAVRTINFEVEGKKVEIIVSGYINYNGLTPESYSALEYTEKHTTNSNTQLSVKLNLFTNYQEHEFNTYNPTVEDILLSSLENSKYFDLGTTTVMPPSAVPIKTPEGIQVSPSSTSSTGWISNVDGKEIQVNEDTLIVSDPIKTPEGIQMPNGKPLEEIAENENEEDFPSCEKDFEKIEFEKVGTAFTHAFPFSIPWDLKRMVDNTFGGIGDEKPSFELTFLGDGVVLSIPDFIDKWMPFARGVVILMFDISILYMFYRLMKGGID